MNGLFAQIRHHLEGLRRTPFHPQWLLGSNRQTASWIGGLAVGNVLDVGCADRWAKSALSTDCRYFALDYPATGGELYRARPDVFADAARLPLQDASIDTVLLLEVLEHLRHPREALSEIARVLRPGGRLLVTVPFLYPVHDAPHDFQRYTEFGLAREIQDSGLVLDHIAPRLGTAQTAGLLVNLAVAGMLSRLLTEQPWAVVLLPLLSIAVLAVNLSAWLLGRLLPTWPALTSGYRLSASKP
jgi:SAM-dependent methyltransferase